MDDAFTFEKGDEKTKGNHRNVTKKEEKRMKDETGLVSRMSKIDINKDERDAEATIKRAMGENLEVGKEQKKIVFKVITELKNKSKSSSGAITLKEIRKKL